jgi:Histidine kinase-, DNA gyrase B-, and HSP90-like ATPase
LETGEKSHGHSFIATNLRQLRDLPATSPCYYSSCGKQKLLSMHTNSGAGLGLALVKEWIEEMGGTVAVESVIGEGSCFSICLPQGCGGAPPAIITDT